jgi:hypothetical protein
VNRPVQSCRDTSAFTLVETLAAVIVLGLLAAAVVPLLRNIGRLTLQERIQAQAYIRMLATPDGLVPGTTRAVDGHPGWSLVVGNLVAEPEPVPAADSLAPAGPPHQWLLVSVRDDDSRSTLAEVVVAVLDAGAQP